MKRPLALFLLAAMLLFSLACTLPQISIISTENYIATQVQKTVESLPQQPPPPAPLPTATAIPLAPTATIFWPTSAPVYVDTTPCYKAAFVSETVPDGTSFNPGQSFTKSWRLRNTGTCAWQSDFRFVFYSGNSMGSPAYITLGRKVNPGETIDLVLNLTAPSTAGTYTGYWRLRAGTGELFAQVYAVIKVKISTTATNTPGFAVTSVTSDGSNASPGACSAYNYNFNITITANKAGTVTYRIVDSVSGQGSLRSVDFSAAGSKTISQSISVSGDGAHAISVYIDNPNHQTFGPFFTITCSTTPAFAVTGVTVSAVQNNPTVACGGDAEVTTSAQVTANGAGTVTYYWEFYTWDDSDQTAPTTLVFSSAGTQTVQHTWTTPVATSYLDFNYHFIKTLPLPETQYNSLIELECQSP